MPSSRLSAFISYWVGLVLIASAIDMGGSPDKGLAVLGIGAVIQAVVLVFK